MTLPIKLDHCVIHVSDWERSNAFYHEVLGAELITRPRGLAYRFGDTMVLAAARDAIASEYATDFAITFETAAPALTAALDAGLHQRGPQDRGQGVVAGLVRKLLELADDVVDVAERFRLAAGALPVGSGVVRPANHAKHPCRKRFNLLG